jgi:GNAT superfamily N-acetyltransferase
MRRLQKPLLKPGHFVDSMLDFTEKGLQFVELIELFDIESEVGPDVIAPVAEAYRSFRCVVNPLEPSKGSLYKAFRRAQKQANVDFFNIGYGDEENSEYDTDWQVWRDGEFLIEGQTVHLVGMQGRSAIGYASIGVSIYSDEDRSWFSLTLSPHLVYVVPKHRGRGYGMALSVAAGWVGRELLEVLYRAVPARSSVGATVTADYDSEGGERFVEHLTASLEVTLDYLREEKRRPSVEVGDMNLDAGW